MTAVVIAWTLVLACTNWLLWKLTGWPIVYCVGRRAAMPIAPYLPLIHLALCAFIFVEGATKGVGAGLRIACVLVGITMLPAVLKAAFGLGDC